MLHNSAWTGSVANAVMAAQDARLAMAGLLALNGPTPLDVRPGILYAHGSPLNVVGTSSTSPWQYSVSAGSYVATKGNTDGPHVGTNDGVVLVSTTNPPGSNSRYDLIYVMQQDADATISPDASTVPLIGVVNGTPGASPAVPATPAGATVLATALVASSASGGTSGAGVTINTGVSRYTTTRGNPIPVRSADERAELTAYEGATDYRLDTHMAEFYDGTAWTDPRTGFLYGEYDPGSATTNTVGFNVDTLVGTGVTFTLTRTRRVRVLTRCRFFASAAGQVVYLRGHYKAGSTAVVAGSTSLGGEAQTLTPSSATTYVTGVSTTYEHTVVLAAGTYTAFPVGGSTTGAVSSFAAPYLAVYDAGTS